MYPKIPHKRKFSLTFTLAIEVYNEYFVSLGQSNKCNKLIWGIMMKWAKKDYKKSSLSTLETGP